MIRRLNSLTSMIIDACALIDFIESERSVLPNIVEYVGPLFVVSPVIGEVRAIEDEQELIDLGLTVKEVEIEDALIAGEIIGPVSFEDYLCYLTAKRCGYTCITNDKNLRKICTKEKVPIIWGLELIAKLHSYNGIKTNDAINIAKLIHKNNPKHITQEIVERFIKSITIKE